MPDVSRRQHNYMEGIAHGMKPRGGGGPSPSVAREFVDADKAEGKFQGRKSRPGTMESLRGRAKTSAERTGKGIRASGRRF